MKLLIETPLNSLSFGNVAFNLIRELYNKNVDLAIFPVGNIDLGSYSLSDNFKQWMQNSINKRWDFVADKAPSLKLWHLNGGENRKSEKQNLLTFYECSEPTNVEISVCKSQDKTLFSSQYAVERFNAAGCTNCIAVPMGFDTDFKITGKKYLDGVVHFGLMGKFEKRKCTEKIIKTWLKRFGNDNRYQLTCCVTNPFFKPQDMQAIIENLFEGKRYTNINFLPYLKTNNEVNELLNAIDIDLTGLSAGEGWNLPSFNATCLGKWSVVSNNTSHKDWANAENSILIEPNGTMPVYDGVFFAEGSDYNQGVFYTWDQDDAISAMEVAVAKCKTQNKKGIELGEQMTYSNTVDMILNSF